VVSDTSVSFFNTARIRLNLDQIPRVVLTVSRVIVCLTTRDVSLLENEISRVLSVCSAGV